MCGIVAVYNVQNASYWGSRMLLQLQHRGQEDAGIVAADGNRLTRVQGPGLVEEVFGQVDFRQRLPGSLAVGHSRYSTAGDPGSLSSIQPFTARTGSFQMALAHNGNLINAAELRNQLESQGAIFSSASDSEIFQHLIAHSGAEGFEARLEDALRQVAGAFSLLILNDGAIHAVVDQSGYRPLWMAEWDEGVLFASETCAFDIFGIKPEQMSEVRPGTILTVSGQPPRTRARRFGEERLKLRHCVFEHVYFSRPDSRIWGTEVYGVREKLGRLLAKRHPAFADAVIAVPDSANVQALGYAAASGLPLAFGLVRNHYTGRTFITPLQKARDLGVKMKLNAVRSVVGGKRIVVVDDSLVRGTTMKKVVKLLRDAGASEVHVRIASPPVVGPCFWGIDIPTREELAAAMNPAEEIRAMIGADSLGYLTVDDLREAVGEAADDYCYACFTPQG